MILCSPVLSGADPVGGGGSLGAEAPPPPDPDTYKFILNYSQLVTEEAGLHCTYLSYQLAPPGKAVFTPA